MKSSCFSIFVAVTLVAISAALSAQSLTTSFVNGSSTDEAAIRAIVATQSADQEDPHVASDLDWENAFGIRYTDLKKRNDWYSANVKPQFKDAVSKTLEVKGRFLEPTVAVADEYWHVTGQVYGGETKPAADRWGRTTYIFERRDGAWMEVMERVADLRSPYYKHYDALPIAVPVASAILTSYAGKYETKAGTQLVEVSVFGDRLTLKTRRGTYTGIPISDTEFLGFDANDLAEYYKIAFSLTPGTAGDSKLTITLNTANGKLLAAGVRVP